MSKEHVERAVQAPGGHVARRWNGWGDEAARTTLSDAAAALLRERLGPGVVPARDVPLAEVVAQVPPSRLAPHPLVTTDPAERVRFARGGSFADLVVLRTGRFPAFPDGVAHPGSREEVRAILAEARARRLRLIPHGGGTSVVGSVNVEPGDAPALVVALDRMSALVSLDAEDRLATFGAGVAGPELEAQLRARGHTLGHFPQSFELSTLGGWVATRSRGQQSLGYGAMEALFAGGHLESPAGPLDLPPHPASSTGLDVREWVLGSEGRLGILTDVTVRISSRAHREVFQAIAFSDLERARACLRELAASEAPVSMLRLSTPAETEMSLAVAGSHPGLAWLERALRLRGVHLRSSALVVAALTGSEGAVRAGGRSVRAAARSRGGVAVPALGGAWQRNRFRAPYLRDALWDLGYGVETVETATRWSRLRALQATLEDALGRALDRDGERVHVFSHLSHVYPSGANLYTTFVFRLCPDPDATHARWKVLKDAASRAILAEGATLSHQHGVGTDHRPYLEAEKGKLALAAMRRLGDAFDPEGVLNPGKLF